MKKDLVIVTAPWSDTEMPLMAPAILKSIATKAGVSSVVYELNAEINNVIRNHPHKNDLIEFFFHGKIRPNSIETFTFELLENAARKILDYSSNIVAISVFSYSSQVSTKWLCYLIKKMSPRTRIVIGGSGILDNLTGHGRYAEDLLARGLIEYYIRGDGENAFYNYLKGNNDFVGINDNVWQELTNTELNQLPIPDYSDYNWNLYPSPVPTLPVLGSRGCVRQCTFCDVHAHWNKFTWRTGQNIFDEIMELSAKHNVYHFKFQDSLINGNMKEYRVLTKLLADYNNTATNPIEWTSFFIFRDMNSFKEEDWELTALSGAKTLLVGVESLSDSVREHMGKKFTNKDLHFALDQCAKRNIGVGMLMIVGYVTETEEDIKFAEQWYRDNRHYADNPIKFINMGGTLGILKNTPLEKNFIKLNLVKTGEHDHDWVNPVTNSTPEQRAQWNLHLRNVIKECGFKEWLSAGDNFMLMEQIIKNNGTIE